MENRRVIMPWYWVLWAKIHETLFVGCGKAYCRAYLRCAIEQTNDPVLKKIRQEMLARYVEHNG